MGIALAFGLTRIWAIAFGIIFIRFLFTRQNLKANISPEIYGIAGIIAITVLWSPAGIKALYVAMAILVVPIVLQNQPNYLAQKQIKTGIYILAGVQLVWGLIEYSTGVTRIHGVSLNASVLGLSGLAMLPYFPSALIIGFSMSRTALIGLVLFALLRNSKTVWIMLAIAVVLHVAITLQIQPNRIQPSGIVQQLENRIETINGTTLEILPDIEIRERELKLLGYGHGGYALSTGVIQPHNVWVLSLWELGPLLVIPFWLFVATLWWRVRANLYLLALLPLGLLTHELYANVEGIFLIGMYHHGTKDLPTPRIFAILLGNRRERLTPEQA